MDRGDRDLLISAERSSTRTENKVVRAPIRTEYKNLLTVRTLK